MSAWALVFINTSSAWSLDTKVAVASLKSAKILAKDSPVEVTQSAPEEATVRTRREPKALEKNCKIEAVLMAKKLMDIDSKEIKRVKVLFYDAKEPDNFWQVTVREGDVKAYGSGEINTDDLLKSLEVTQSSAPKANKADDASAALQTNPAKMAGALGAMVGLANALERVESHGLDTQRFRPLYSRLEKILEDREFDYVIAETNRLKMHELPISKGQAKPAAPDSPSYWRKQSQKNWNELIILLGKDTPTPGPFFAERCFAVARIRELEKKGRNDDRMRMLYSQLQDFAPHGNPILVRAKVKMLERSIQAAADKPARERF